MRPEMKKILPLLSTIIFLYFLSGCVAGQKIPYAYNPTVVEVPALNTSVESTVVDVRPFIVNNNKHPSYIGHFRGGFGNTWQVNTRGKLPLADVFQQDLQKELLALGAQTGTHPGKIVRVEIVDYNFDAYLNGRFWYKFKIAVYDEAKRLLAEDTIQNEHVIKGSFWVGPVFAFKREIPILHAQIVRELVRDNEKILNALRN